jgi:hypothetical protein
MGSPVPSNFGKFDLVGGVAQVIAGAVHVSVHHFHYDGQRSGPLHF